MNESPKRILLVDNDLDVLESVKYNLETAGYEVLTADSPGKARELLAREIVHLAIVDIRLEYEDRAEDISGFNVARELPDYIPCVIFTAYEDRESIRKALGEVGAKASLDKKKPGVASQLIDIVDELFASEVKVNFNLKIDGSLNLDGVTGQIEVPVTDKELQPSADDVWQVFQALFYDAASVYVTPLLSPEPAPTFTQAGSMLLQARPHFEEAWGAPMVIKLSARDEIAREANNYRIIKPFLGGYRLAVLEGETLSRQIGGLVYRLIGAQDWESIRTFGEVFLDEDTETVTDLLERFFGQTFGTLFADARRETINLTATYTEALSLTPKKLRKALEEFHPEALASHMCVSKDCKAPT